MECICCLESKLQPDFVVPLPIQILPCFHHLCSQCHSENENKICPEQTCKKPFESTWLDPTTVTPEEYVKYLDELEPKGVSNLNDIERAISLSPTAFYGFNTIKKIQAGIMDEIKKEVIQLKEYHSSLCNCIINNILPICKTNNSFFQLHLFNEQVVSKIVQTIRLKLMKASTKWIPCTDIIFNSHDIKYNLFDGFKAITTFGPFFIFLENNYIYIGTPDYNTTGFKICSIENTLYAQNFIENKVIGFFSDTTGLIWIVTKKTIDVIDWNGQLIASKPRLDTISTECWKSKFNGKFRTYWTFTQSYAVRNVYWTSEINDIMRNITDDNPEYRSRQKLGNISIECLPSKREVVISNGTQQKNISTLCTITKILYPINDNTLLFLSNQNELMSLTFSKKK